MRFVALLLSICCILCFAFADLSALCDVAYADAEYAWARITKNGVNLYADEDCTKTLFTLEKTYYVQIIQTLDKVYAVSVMENKSGFPAMVGYVRKIEVKPTEVAPVYPLYPTVQIAVTADSAQLKLLPLSSAETVIAATTTQKLNYYGTISYYGKDWYYVYFAGKFGYVEVENTAKPQITPHPTPLENSTPVIKPGDGDEYHEGEVTQPPANSTPTAEILLIVFVVLLAGGLTLALFLPVKNKKSEVFEEDI